MLWGPVLVSEGYAVDYDVDHCDVEGDIEAENVQVIEGLSDFSGVT